jgi:hypothetical protein
MKKRERLLWLLLVLSGVMFGETKVYLPLDCITGFLVDKSKCVQKGDYAVCDGVIVKYACIRVKETK